MHLIRWNLKAVLCQLGQELTTVPVQGIIARPLGLGTESRFPALFSPTSSPLVPYLMLSSLPKYVGSVACFGVCRFSLCQVGSGASVFPPPPLVLVRVRRPSAFFFSLAFQGLPAPGQVCWCVFALSFFFCVPLFASWLSNVHLIFSFISFFIPHSYSSSSHYYAHHPAGGRVCVCVPSE